MRVLLILLLTLGLFTTVHAADEVTGRVIKVLPFLVDLKGQIALSPSLYDRDAYQAHLRQHTNQVSALRYDVQWSSQHAGEAKLKLRLELRGLGEGNTPKFKTLAADVTPGFFSQWTQLTLDGEDYRKFGAVTAWRATLWDGDRLVGEHKSFLW
jgi:hypothetical protein